MNRRDSDPLLPFPRQALDHPAPPPVGAPPVRPGGGGRAAIDPAVTSSADEDEAGPVLSVYALGVQLRALLEGATADVRVAGEVRGMKVAGASGHAYFSLKDEEQDASLECVMYRTAPYRARRLLEEGVRIVAQGRVTTFVSRGRMQLVVANARLAGRGAYLEALERLKQKLLGEGLFEPGRKRALPKDPRVIGVVTSAHGAALQDIVTVAFRRGPVRIILSPAPVQGIDAAPRLVRALKMLANVQEVEAIIVGRGGGAAEDLSPFDDEDLVRAIASCPVPVISAVGHEVNISLADLAADARAATPSEAAELLIPDAGARLRTMAEQERRLRRAVHTALQSFEQRLESDRVELRDALERDVDRRTRRIQALDRRLADRHPRAVLATSRVALSPLVERLSGALSLRLVGAQAELAPAIRRMERAGRQLVAQRKREMGGQVERLSGLSPLAVLHRGYAIATDENGRAIRDAEEVNVGDAIRVRVDRGTLLTSVLAREVPDGTAGRKEVDS